MFLKVLPWLEAALFKVFFNLRSLPEAELGPSGWRAWGSIKVELGYGGIAQLVQLSSLAGKGVIAKQ
jgi:hypothetical protein